MKMRVSVLLALRFLGIGSGTSVSNARKSLFGAIMGIGISLVPLVIVLVVADGMIEGISSRIIELSSSHLRIADYSLVTVKGGDSADDSAEVPPDLSAIAANLVASSSTAATGVTGKTSSAGHIAGANAERQGIGIVIGPKGRSGATVRAVEGSFFAPGGAVLDLLAVSDGTPSFSGPNEAFLGKKLASDIGAAVGDTFRILTMRTGAGGAAIPRFSTFTVKAIVSSGYQELDALWVFIPYETGGRILDAASSQAFINVRTADPFANLEPLRYGLMRDLPAGLSVYTWKELNRSQFQSFTTTRTLLLFIMMLIVLVASVNVSSALVMLVMERRKEIAILKSTGASPSGITFAFLLAGFFTGLGGVLAGMPAGIFCAIHINTLFSWMERVINTANSLIFILSGDASRTPEVVRLLDPSYYLETIPVHLQYRELLLIAAGTLILSVLVSVLPAIRAGQEKPLDTIRKF